MFNCMRKQVEMVCDHCGKKYYRAESEVKRNAKLGRANYCSLNCVARNSPGSKMVKNRYPVRRSSDEYSMFRECLRRVRNRNREKDQQTDLTIEYLKSVWDQQQGVCPYTGFKMTPISSHTGRLKLPTDMSLDRIDSSKPYIQGNVQFVAMVANFLKSDFTTEQTIEVCKQIAAHWK